MLLCPWKKINARENFRKYAREFFFVPVKKNQKPRVCPEKWQVRREKSEKSEKEWAWNSDFAREKMQKKIKNWFSHPPSFSRKKKKTRCSKSEAGQKNSPVGKKKKKKKKKKKTQFYPLIRIWPENGNKNFSGKKIRYLGRGCIFFPYSNWHLWEVGTHNFGISWIF